MYTVTITASPDGSVSIQDPLGLDGIFSSTLEPSEVRTIEFTDSQFDHIKSILDSLVTGGYLTYTYHNGSASSMLNDSVVAGTTVADALNTLAAGGGGGGTRFVWLYKTEVGDADPGSGNFRLNNIDPTLATYVYMSIHTTEGVDVESILSDLRNNVKLSIDPAGADAMTLYTCSGSPVDGGNYYKIPVTFVDRGPDPLTLDMECDVEFIAAFAHKLGSDLHEADTLANLNAKITDATLDDSSSPRTPTSHLIGGAEHGADTLANFNLKITDGDVTTLALVKADPEIAAALASGLSYRNSVLNSCVKLFDDTPDVILNTSGVNDLQTAITALTDDQLLEVQSNGPFNPITLPAGKKFRIRAGFGYAPVLTGSECIKIADGASEIIVSGLVCDGFTSTYSNGRGGAVTLATNHTKCDNIIFHQISFNNASACAAVIIAYYNGSDYALAPSLVQMSSNVAFVDCYCYAGAVGVSTEGANINLRGVNNSLIYKSFINANSQGRGIQLQDCIRAWVENNRVLNCNDGANGEGIKVDELGTISGYRNTAFIIGNLVSGAIEGIDIDDKTDAVVLNNTVSRGSAKAIGLDDSSTAIMMGNTCYASAIGILAEAGSTIQLKNNTCFGNTTNYSMLNGYTVDASNSTTIDKSLAIDKRPPLYSVTRVNAATYDLLAGDLILHVDYTVTGAVTNLRFMSALCYDGNRIEIKDSGCNAAVNSITITTEGTEKIITNSLPGADTFVINTNGDSFFFTARGGHWYVT